MDIINGLHGLGVALAVAAGVTLISLFAAFSILAEVPPHAVKIIVAALSMAVVAGFLIGATS